jgi:hypothetical protein
MSAAWALRLDAELGEVVANRDQPHHLDLLCPRGRLNPTLVVWRKRGVKQSEFLARRVPSPTRGIGAAPEFAFGSHPLEAPISGRPPPRARTVIRDRIRA